MVVQIRQSKEEGFGRRILSLANDWLYLWYESYCLIWHGVTTVY